MPSSSPIPTNTSSSNTHLQPNINTNSNTTHNASIHSGSNRNKNNNHNNSTIYNNTNNTNTKNTNTISHTNSSLQNSPSNNSMTTLRKPLDPTLLARGMTARSVGSRISSNIKSLTTNEIEKDFRHMEAYGSACIVYAQQFFAYTNRELIARGHFGHNNGGAGSGAGIGNNGMMNGLLGSNAGVGDSTFAPNGNEQSQTDTNGTNNNNNNNNNNNSNVGMGGITMPVRIDPEEEKRLSILRTRVAASEAKREILETEYLSLRAHYVHESHKLHRARSVVSGQMKLFMDLVKRRGDVLGLYRARYGIAKDILHSLEYRSDMLKKKVEEEEIGVGVEVGADNATAMDLDGNNGNNGGVEGGGGKDEVNETKNNNIGQSDSNNDVIMSATEKKNEISVSASGTDENNEKSAVASVTDSATAATAATTTAEEETKINTTTKDKTSSSQTSKEDMSAIWDMIETQLVKAEQACTSNVETPEELLQMKAALAADAAALEAATERSSSFANGSIIQQRNSSVRSPTRGAGNNEEEDDNNNGKKRNNGKRGDEVTSSDGGGGNGKRISKAEGDTNTIPWSCPVYPRTPYDVAILLSNLSTAPDGAAAFACGDSEGRQSKSLLWLEANLPVTENGEMDEEAERLEKVREAVKELSTELSREVRANSDLQKEIIQGRKRRDQLCSMMSMIRSETEAVIERYNEVLQTPEVMSEVDSLQQSKTQMDDNVNYIEEYDEEGDLGDGENSEEGTVVPGDGDDEGDDTVEDLLDPFNTGSRDDFNNGGQPMKEITVRLDQSNENDASIGKNTPILNNNKRGYDVSDTTEPINDSENKRRKI